jgi:hypothetical protein
MTIEHYELNRIEEVKNYVCTFEQAEKLYNLGAKFGKPNLFYWRTIKYLQETDKRRLFMHSPLNEWTEFCIESFYEHVPGYFATNKREYKTLSAFTSQELGELISSLFPDLRVAQTLKKDKVYESDGKIGYLFLQEHCSGMWLECSEIYTSCAKTEAQARAQFLIHLLEKKRKMV